MNLAPPYILLEVPPEDDALRAWTPEYTFDATDAGRLEPLPQFLFELKAEKTSTDRRGRTLRLYLDGQPCVGAQWQYSVASALHSVDHIVGSYAYQRRAAIYDHQRKQFVEETPCTTKP